MSASIETLLSRLDGVRQVRPNGWMSRCPAHNGDGRSLAVTDKAGHILIHCFAHQCDVDDILGAVGMSVGDLFPEPLPERRYVDRIRQAVPAIDVLRVMKHELAVVEFLVSDVAAGHALDDGLCARAMQAAGRVRKALDLCDG